MHWSHQPIDLDGTSAAVIAAGMRAVARADGDVHPRELELIEAFEKDLPTEGLPHPRAVLASGAVRAAYVRSLVMVALADGAISPAERTVIARLVADLGIDEQELGPMIDDVKRWFLQRFQGVTVFRDAVDEIARDLGLDPGVLDEVPDAS